MLARFHLTPQCRWAAAWAVAAAIVPLAVFTGCQEQARVVEGSQRITTVRQIDVQDWENAAAAATNDMLSSDSFNAALTQASHKPALLAMSRIRNDTTQYVDTDLLAKKIRVILLNTGKVVTTTTFGKDAEDPKAKDINEAQKFYNDEHNRPPDFPDLTLSGKIIQVSARAGSTRQSTFVFQLTLTQTQTGYAIWEGEKQITKQGKRDAIGY